LRRLSAMPGGGGDFGPFTGGFTVSERYGAGTVGRRDSRSSASLIASRSWL
jgi:hypothetical protein